MATKADLKSQQGFVYISNIFYCAGFTYIGLLLLIAITGFGLSVAGISWRYQVRSEKEQELLFVGEQFRSAINSYYASTPDAKKVYPLSLKDLLLDNRVPNIKRHLRKIYPDPITGKAEWGLLKQQGRIVGVYSLSTLAPFKHKGFNVADGEFVDAKSYKDWMFASVKVDKGLMDLSGPGLSPTSAAAQSNSINNSSVINSADPVKNADTMGSQSAMNITGSTASTASSNNSENTSNPEHLNKLQYYIKYGVVPDYK